jgi:large subunit ribosomal protein L32e
MMAGKKEQASKDEVQTKEEKKGKKPSSKDSSGKIKPDIDEKTAKLLEIRKERYDRQPSFKRGEWFRYKRVGTNWRRPRAVTNKMRLNRKYRPPKVRVGYGKPAAVRHIHPSGFREVMVHNRNDLEGIDPKIHAARIGSTVGTRKRKDIIEAADSKGIRVLNRGVF